MGGGINYGVLQPDELQMVRNVFRRADAEGLIPAEAHGREEFAARLLRHYFVTWSTEEEMHRFAIHAAAKHFQGSRPAEEIQLPTSRILIAEDDYFLASELAAMFRSVGATVLGPVAREADAISILKTEPPDMAVVDINLGQGPSFELAEFVQRQSIPLCVLTGYKREDFSALPKELKSAPWLEKPVNTRAILAVAAHALGLAH